MGKMSKLKPNRKELHYFALDYLSSDRTQEITRMLKSDSALAQELTQIEYEIGKYVADNDPLLLPEGLKTGEDCWRDFINRYGDSLKLQTVNSFYETKLYQRSHLTKLWQGRSYLTSRPALAVFFILIISVFIYFYQDVRSVSAEEFLQESITFERDQGKELADPIIHRKLLIQKRTTGKVDIERIEYWSDIRANKFKSKTNPTEKKQAITPTNETWNQLGTVLRQNSFKQPFSAFAFDSWRKRIAQKSDRISEIELVNNQKALQLTTIVKGLHSLNSITEASLTVNSDWQIISQEIKVQDSDNTVIEYSFSEIYYEVVSNSEIHISFDDSIDLSLNIPEPRNLYRDVDENISTTLSDSDSINTEIAALYEIHKLGADLDGQIEVDHSVDGKVTVEGIPETGILKKKLEDALSQIPHLNLKLSSRKVRSAQSNQQYNETIDNTKPIDNLSYTLIVESEKAYREAWALKQLVNRTKSEEFYKDPRIIQMRDTYLAKIKVHCTVIRKKLEPALMSITSKPIDRGMSQTHSMHVHGVLVYESVEALFKLLRQNFASRQTTDTTEKTAKEIMNELMQLNTLLSN